MSLSTCPSIGDVYNYLDNANYISPSALQISHNFVCSNVTNQGKLASDEEDIEASGKFMWIVNATYTDTTDERGDWTSIKSSAYAGADLSSALPASSYPASVPSSVGVSAVPPWNEKPNISFTPTKIEESPVYKAYNNQGNETDFVNSAGTWLKNSYDKYGLRINISRGYEKLKSWGFTKLVTNADKFIIGGTEFNQKTLLLYPYGHTIKYWRNAGQTYKYYDYSFEFLYNPAGWLQKFLNAGIKGKCYNNRTGIYGPQTEQIYKYTWWDSIAVSGQYNYGGLQMMLDLQAEANAANLSAGQENILFAYEAITEPVLLTANGYVNRLTIERRHGWCDI